MKENKVVVAVVADLEKKNHATIVENQVILLEIVMLTKVAAEIDQDRETTQMMLEEENIDFEMITLQSFLICAIIFCFIHC